MTNATDTQIPTERIVWHNNEIVFRRCGRGEEHGACRLPKSRVDDWLWKQRDPRVARLIACRDQAADLQPEFLS